jgi:hypothetical protein
MKLHSLIALLPCVALFGACGSTGSDPGQPNGGTCVPGVTRTCTCTGADTGVQICTSDGAGFGTCSCGGMGGTGAVGTGGTGGSAGADASTAYTPDPCSSDPVWADCSSDCGGTPASVCTACVNAFSINSNSTSEKKFVFRTAPASATSSGCCKLGTYGGIQASFLKTLKTWKVTVGKPWKVVYVPFEPPDDGGCAVGGDPNTNCCEDWDYQSGCVITEQEGFKYIADGIVWVTTMDPNAPARNVVFEEVPGGTPAAACSPSDYWN